jgi:hypothetical protein
MHRTSAIEDRSQSYTGRTAIVHVQRDPYRQVTDGPFVLCLRHPFDNFKALHSSLDKVPNRALRGLDRAA